MIESLLDTARSVPVRVLSLARPERRNALTVPMLADLARAIREAERETESRAIVLTGRGHVFCAGFDMLLTRDDPEMLAHLLRGLAEVIGALRACRKPVVIGVFGAAIAGGCAMLGGADVVVTDPTARLGYPVVKLGISPAVSAPTLSPMIGSGRARERLLNPELIDGAEAFRIGLAHVIVDQPEDVVARAMSIARDMGSKSPHAMSATKQLLGELDGSGDVAKIHAALSTSLALVDSPEQIRLVAQLWDKPSAKATRDS